MHAIATAALWILSGLLAIVGVFGVHPLRSSPTPTQPTTQAQSTLPTKVEHSAATSPTNQPATSTATSTPTKAPSASTATKKQVAKTPVTPSISFARKVDDVAIAQATQSLRASTVNLLCTGSLGGYRQSVSGSGVMIDPHGVVLTSAHVAQFMLLKTFSCSVRTGSPASTKYQAELLYLPPAWVADNASKIVQPDATSTGENDYAFLYLPNAQTTFVASDLTTSIPVLGAPAIIAAYPAQYLNGTTVQTDLYISSAATTVDALYTFVPEGTTVDEIALGASALSQSGSSGGGVARGEDGAVFGIITTQSQGASTAERERNAISIDHINRSLQEFGKGGVGGLMTGDIAKKADDFAASTAPALSTLLQNAIH